MLPAISYPFRATVPPGSSLKAAGAGRTTSWGLLGLGLSKSAEGEAAPTPAPAAPPVLPRFPAGVDPTIAQHNTEGFHGTFSPNAAPVDGILAPLFRPFGETGHAIYSQLPRVRLPDTLVGGGVGALTGLAGNAVRNAFRTRAEKRKDPGWLRAALYGAAGGAALGNVVGDRTRRYISNKVEPVGYNDTYDATTGETRGSNVSPMSRLMPRGWGDVWRGAILDERLYDRPTDAATFPGARSNARWELYRRQLGVHTDHPTNDVFARQPNGAFSLNPNNSSAGNYLQHLLLPRGSRGQLGAAAPDVLAERANTDATGPNHGLMNQVVGGQTTAVLPGQDATLLHQRDRWDYTLDPAQRDYLYRNALRAFNPAFRQQQIPEGMAYDYASRTATNSQLLGSLASRELMDRVVGWENPWVEHWLRGTQPQNHSGPASARPWNYTPLTGEGRAYPARAVPPVQ